MLAGIVKSLGALKFITENLAQYILNFIGLINSMIYVHYLMLGQ